MKIHTLLRKQIINKPIDEVFAFFDRPENLGDITPDFLNFSIMTPSPVAMKEGAVIDYSIKMMGIPMRWRSLISTYEPPYRFVDEQLRGPYSFWHHTHTFEEFPNGTLVTDRVLYAVPLGILGRVAHPLFVRGQLDRIFDHRFRVVEQYFAR